MKLLILVICSVWVLGDAKYDYSGYEVLRVTPTTETSLNVLKKLKDDDDFDFWTVPKALNRPVDFMVPPNRAGEIHVLLKYYNIDYKLVLEDVQRSIDIIDAASPDLGRSDGGVTFEKYERFDDINKYLESIAEENPDIATVINIGKSFEGRDLKLLKVSTGGNGTKPAIFIDGGIHAREWIAPAQVLYIIQELVENRTSTQNLTNEVDWYLLPVLNPDGYEYSHEKQRLWRKTRQQNPNSKCFGADGNRNMDFHWSESGVSFNPCSDTYPGPTSFSEPETKALMDFGLKVKDQVKLYISFHSFGPYILYPWSYDYSIAENADQLQELGERAAKVMENEYEVGSSSNLLYPTAGSTDDWFMGVANVSLAYTIELPGGSFIVPPENILEIVRDTFKGITVFGNYVRDTYGNKKLNN